MNKDIFDLNQYNYEVPQTLIAQQPVSPRDISRILIADRSKKTINEGIFKDSLGLFNAGDVLVLNNTKVIKARLIGKKENGGKIEVLLLKKIEKSIWEVLVKPGKRARLNDTVIFNNGGVTAKIIDRAPMGIRTLQFDSPDLESLLIHIGKVPLPPYIKREISDFKEYQTVYAEKDGAVAAPTAGLHFTPELIRDFKEKGVKVTYVTLHCGLSTFRPIKTEDIRDHKIGVEWIEISSATAETVNSAKRQGKRIVAVGTTSVRALESVAFMDNGPVARIKSFFGETGLYIIPGYKFKIVDSLITNFHTPCSTNLVLVSCFCGLKLFLESYNYAKSNNFRFYSFGDAMIIP